MNAFDIEQVGKGAYHIEDKRDYAFGATTPYDWSSPEMPDLPLPIKAQASSLSCVGQTASEIADTLYYIRTGQVVDFSARFVYSQIFLPNGGAQLRDGMEVLTKKSVETDKHFPSSPQDEQHMRDQTGINYEQALIDFDSAGLKYAAVEVGIDSFASALRDHGCMMIGVYGSNNEWHTADVAPPANISWGHAIKGVKPVIRNGKKAIKFQNHWGNTWGDKGYGYLYEDYFLAGRVMTGFVPTTNYTIPNPPPPINPPNPQPMPFLPADHLVQDVQQSGAFGIVIDRVIHVASPDRVAALLATYIMRGSKGVTPLDKDSWNNTEKVNF